MGDVEKERVRELHNVMCSIDGRSFIYNLMLSCGIDALNGIPTNRADDFTLGQRKIGIDIFNKIYYNEREAFGKMISEQQSLSNKKKGDLDD